MDRGGLYGTMWEVERVGECGEYRCIGEYGKKCVRDRSIGVRIR